MDVTASQETERHPASGDPLRLYLAARPTGAVLAGTVLLGALTAWFGLVKTPIPMAAGSDGTTIPLWRMIVLGAAVLPILALYSSLADLEQVATRRLRSMQRRYLTGLVIDIPGDLRDCVAPRRARRHCPVLAGLARACAARGGDPGLATGLDTSGRDRRRALVLGIQRQPGVPVVGVQRPTARRPTQLPAERGTPCRRPHRLCGDPLASSTLEVDGRHRPPVGVHVAGWTNQPRIRKWAMELAIGRVTPLG